MNYKKQKEEIINYLQSHEKKREDYKLGVEFEHFLIYKDSLDTVSYYGDLGVEETLKDLTFLGYKAEYEGDYLLGLKKGKKNITLEPGSQVELSIDATISIEEIEKEYLEFLCDIVPILERKNQEIIAIGYHPKTKIDDIKLLPKQRYNFMFNYFKTKGKHAHNMMKGTAALQVSLDYSSEEDYSRKFRLANIMTPILYGLFENVYYFENKESDKHNMRSYIWKHCDIERSGIVDYGIDKDYSYAMYADYILNRPPIFINVDGEEKYTGNKQVRDLFNPDNYKVEELEHMMTMFFPDVRTKKFIEIRVMDSLPYPLSLSVVALIKGLFYSEKNLLKLEEIFEDITMEDINICKKNMLDTGINTYLGNKKIIEYGHILHDMALLALKENEKKFLEPLKDMIDKNLNPYEITKMKSKEGKRKSIEWCILNKIMEG